jgi:Protein of unknown function (DUF3047)
MTPLPLFDRHTRPPSRRAWLVAAGALASGCASTPVVTDADGWHDVPLPGKSRTDYRWEGRGAQRELVARADRSASMFRRRLDKPAGRFDAVEFGWWTQALPEGADVGEADATDAAARVLFAFGGDTKRLPQRTQLMFELARTLSGEAPPFATLTYVWDTRAAVGSVVTHPRTDRVRKIVVESGHTHLGRWRHYRRSLAADYRLAFGEAPGPLVAVAVMTDGDNTKSRLVTRYRDIRIG